MREPQVDRFCRCVKKVRKTLKARPGSEDRSTAEGRAIAVCTKSVLQTKGRTLKKVNCSKHVLETQPIKAGRRTRKQRNDTIERNKTHTVYIKDDTIKTPPDTERITGLPVGQAGALADICRVNGNETIDANYLTKVPHSAALILFFGKKHEVDILRAKYPLGNLPIEKAKGFAIINLVGDDLEVDALCAHESTRGKGVGANALKFVESMATLNGKKRVLLDALPDAVPFYIKQGYKNTRDNMYAKELAPQTGGVFKWMGADTPVFNNEAVDDWNGFPVMLHPNPELFDGWITTDKPVVRMVSEADGELGVHKILRKMLDDTKPFNQPFVKMHFNLVVNRYAIYPVDYYTTLTRVRSQNDDGKTARLIGVGNRFGKDRWFGLVTRTQERDVVDLDPEPQRNAMCAFLRVLLRIDGRMIHADLHRGNMAIMFDGKPVIHDVGRMKIRDAAVMPGAPPRSILKNALYSRFDNPNYFMSLSQHFYIARMFKKIRKAYGEVFPKPTAAHGWVQDYKQPEPKSDIMFKAWLDAKASGADETNYVQIARVYDILSVLKGLSDLPRYTKANTPALLTAYYYARKAAVNLTNHLFGGYATKENVEKIVRSFLVLSGTNEQCGGRPAYGETFEAPEDRYAATYMTSDGGFVDETRGNPSSAPPPPPPLRRSRLARTPVPESVDLSEIGSTEKALRAQEDALNKAMIESLSRKGDADAIEKLAAIKAAIETPDDIKAAAAKAFTEPAPAIPAAELEAEDDIEVGLEVRAEDTSAAEKAEIAAQGRFKTGETMVVGPDGVAAPAAAPKGGRRSFKKRLPRLL